MTLRNDALAKLGRLLGMERAVTQKHKNTRTAREVENARTDLLAHIREIGRSGDLALIVATERAIVEGDLAHYANSRSMTSSLTAARGEMAVIQWHIGIVDDPTRYRAVDQTHRLPKNRKAGLPFDEARQALISHYARLGNLDKSRLDDEEKKVLDARRAALWTAIRLYTQRQARTLGVDLATAPD